jgi:hypothetical protein
VSGRQAFACALDLTATARHHGLELAARMTMVAVTDKALRIRESRAKICTPFELDETLCRTDIVS